MALTPAQRTALLAQTSCGMPELRKFLEGEIDFIELCQDQACFPQLRYYYVQLALIEAAQVFARNKIDTATRTAASELQERYTAFSTRLTDAERTATGRSCAWAAATSAQFFNRDSTDNTVGFSEANSLFTAERLENGYDRSYRTTNGHGSHFSRVIHTLDEKNGERLAPGEGLEISRASRTSATSGGTDSLLPLYHPTVPIVTFSASPPFVTFLTPDLGGPLPNFPGNDEVICTDEGFDPPPGETDPSCPRSGFPSMGIGYNRKVNVSISLAAPGFSLDIRADIGDGFNVRQYYHCSSSAVRGTSTTTGRDAGLATARTIARPWENFTNSSERSVVVHLVRKEGSSTRRGTQSVDAEETQVARANGLAHSESDRNVKAQAYQQSRAEQLTTQHQESHLTRTETATDDFSSSKFGQIPAQLKQLWDRVWAHITLLERQFAAVPKAAPMACSPSTACCLPLRAPYRNRYAY